MLDEQEVDEFTEQGYPNVENQRYVTSWGTYTYGRNTAYMKIMIDLGQTYALDKVFICDKNSGLYTVYGYADDRT
ncbi:MAG: hypothetical protein EOM35_07080 [Negativicutes bacterium]|nr:hypothetical protein [Negativicutes bacterium]